MWIIDWARVKVLGKERCAERHFNIKLNKLQKELLKIDDDKRGIVVFGRQGSGISTGLRARALILIWEDNQRDILFLGEKFEAPKQIRFEGEVTSNTILVIDNADEIGDWNTRMMPKLMACKTWVVGGEYAAKETNPLLIRLYCGCDLQIEIAGNSRNIAFSNKPAMTVGIKSIL